MMAIDILTGAAAFKNEVNAEVSCFYGMGFKKLDRQEWDLSGTHHFIGLDIQHVDILSVGPVIMILETEYLEARLLKI